MKVLYVSAEVEPFAKSGGLGDVIGALPKAMAESGCETSVVMPKYTKIIPQKYQEQMEYLGYIYVDLNWRHQYCGIFRLIIDGVKFYFLDSEYYFGGDMYCFADNERFAFFSKAALDLVLFLQESFDVIHCNDWSSGLVPVLFDAYYRNLSSFCNTKLVYTVHNLRYQGWISKGELQDLTGLDDGYFTQERLMFGDSANIMKAAIVFSDAVTTVSDTYAQEIKTVAYGEGLQDVINRYSYKICGIINGVDYSAYNPQKDGFLCAKYSAKTVKTGKAKNKRFLQEKLGLRQSGDVITIGLISRLVDQKGLYLVDCVMQRLMNARVQVVVLGTGEKRYEDMFRYYSSICPDKVSANITFSNELAHQIYSACDLFLMPSDFEPCGLSQLIALKYGALPLVRETGGLKDTVLSYNEQTLQGNGFSFANSNPDDFWYTICRALTFYYERRDEWDNIVQNAMTCDFSWKNSSKKYLELYRNLTGK